MKTTPNTLKNTNEEALFFGIPLMCDKSSRQDFKTLVAKLFLNPQITPEHVIRYLDQLQRGIVSVDRLLKLTDKGMQAPLLYQSSESDLSSMHDKIQEWTETFGELSTADWAYLEKHFGLNRDTFMSTHKDPLKKEFHSPKEMAAHVNKFVIGQEEVVNALSVPIFQQNDSLKNNYHFRIASPMVLIGRTGTGKSMIWQEYKRISKCPIIYINCGDFSPNSWKGDQLSEILVREIKDGRTIEELKYAIIVFDEFDKIPEYDQKTVGEKEDSYVKAKMNLIMGLFDQGHELFLGDGFKPDGTSKGYKLPVDDMLPMFIGAFTGIEDIISKRLIPNKSIGFRQLNSEVEITEAETEALLKKVSKEDLQTWGFNQEFVGRIGRICVLNSFTPDTIYNILTNAKDNILQKHIEYSRLHNIDLSFTSEALHLIAEVVYKTNCGFREVKPTLSKYLDTTLYFEELSDLPKTKDVLTINVDCDYIAKQLNVLTK